MSQESNKKITPETNVFGVKVMGLNPKSPRVSQPSAPVPVVESAEGDASVHHYTSSNGSKK